MVLISCSYHVHMVFISCRYRFPIMFISCSYHVHMVFILCLSPVHMVFISCSYGVHIVFLSFSYGVYIAFIWCSYRVPRQEILLSKKFLKSCYDWCVLVYILKLKWLFLWRNNYSLFALIYARGLRAYPIRENFENMVQFGAFWCIFCILKK